MCVVAAADRTGRPAVGRGVGFRLLEDRETIDVIFSGWQWPRLETSIPETGKLAVTFVSPSDYISFQLKGTATLRDAEPLDHERARCFMSAATAELRSLGVAGPMIGSWLTLSGARVARLKVSEIYVQTPGPRAGMLSGARAE